MGLATIEYNFYENYSFLLCWIFTFSQVEKITINANLFVSLQVLFITVSLRVLSVFISGGKDDAYGVKLAKIA